MNLIVTKKFAKDVEKELSAQQKEQLAILLTTLTEYKTLSQIPDCKKLKGFTNAYRIKFGDFRIGFLWQDDGIYLSRILNRKDVYKYFP